MAVIIVSLISLGMIEFATDLGSSYGETADFSSLNKTQARLEAQQQTNQELSDEITSFTLETPLDFLLLPYQMVQIGWFVGKNMFSSWATVGTMVIEIGDGLSEKGIPLPSWLIPSLISLMVIVLSAIIIYGFFKWKFQD